MNNNIKEKFLPIGTVVVLNNGEQPLMITSYTPIVKDAIYDYSACLFPIGYAYGVDKGNFIFNHTDIKEILYCGYENDKFKELNELLHKVEKEYKEKNNNSNKTG